MRTVFFLLAVLQIGGVAMANDSNTVEAGITRELARARFAQISDLRYRLSVTIEPGASRIKGRVEIRCRLAIPRDQLVLDFRDLDSSGRVIDGVVVDLAINGEAVSEVKQSHGHVLLPGALFTSGENLIALSFETGIAPAGRPITRFVDRDDGSEYIYTLFVPMDASLAFPCFDQPDLKGKLTLELTAPVGWQVASNGVLERNIRDGRRDYTTHVFRETPPISTYLFAFAAGPFDVIGRSGGLVPLELYVRKSKGSEGFRESDEVFDLTIRGMRHLAEFFGQPFPFAKYSQVLLPGFAYGGMEHAGATFLREEAILFRTTPTVADKLNRASLILHELTHQWFGDLVTMKWFDDLWLKEGFANYMASHAMDAYYQEPNRVDVWKRFYQVHKPAAYAIDSTQGTTPIYQVVNNLNDAKSAYGAIVYQKAPSLLRALSFTIGETQFRDGVRLFLKEHAYGNAEWADLIDAFERASGKSLEDWAVAWVTQRGMPRVDVEWSCDDQGRLGRVLLRQRDVLGDGRRWPIKTQLLLAYQGHPSERITVELKSETSVLAAEGRTCPVYIFANDGDYAYGRFLLDKRSRAGVVARLHEAKDPFLRSMLWGALWDAVRELEMAPGEYLALAMRHLQSEQDEELTQGLLSRVTIAFQRYLSLTERNDVAAGLEKLCLERMQRGGEPGLRITFYRALRSLAWTETGRQQLKATLAGSVGVPGVELKPLDRWQTLRALLGLGDADAEKLFADEKVRDKSDEGRKQAYVMEAARRTSATKERYFDDYLQNRSIPEDWIEGSLASFNFWDQSELTLPYLRKALEALPSVKRERKIFFGLAWLNAFVGGQRSPEALSTVQEFLKHGPLDPDLRLKVLEVADELERTVRIRARPR